MKIEIHEQVPLGPYLFRILHKQKQEAAERAHCPTAGGSWCISFPVAMRWTASSVPSRGSSGPLLASKHDPKMMAEIFDWKLCRNMRAEDVTDTIDIALAASG
jgi:hypothetical protein